VLGRALIVTCVLAGTSRADQPTLITLRFDLPTEVRTTDDAWYQFFGAVASVRARRFLAVEAAADYWADPCVNGVVLTGRGGVAPTFAERGTWAFSAPVLAGVTYGNLGGGGCDGNPDETMLALTAAVGIEASRARRGAAVRLLVIGGKRRDVHTDDTIEWETMYTATLSIGFVFPP
jgi:hypothetical protein